MNGYACTNILCWKHGERARQDHSFRGPTAVKTQRPIQSDDEHVVVKFRPRTSAHPPGHRDEPDDFRYRMLANVAALAFTVALTAIGIWLAMSIADLRKTQDCVLMGRRDCARISVMPRS